MLSTWLAFVFLGGSMASHFPRYRLCHPGMSSLIMHGEHATFRDDVNIQILEHLSSLEVEQIWARDVRVPGQHGPGTEKKSAILSVLFSKDPFPSWERSTLPLSVGRTHDFCRFLISSLLHVEQVLEFSFRREQLALQRVKQAYSLWTARS